MRKNIICSLMFLLITFIPVSLGFTADDPLCTVQSNPCPGPLGFCTGTCWCLDTSTTPATWVSHSTLGVRYLDCVTYSSFANPVGNPASRSENTLPFQPFKPGESQYTDSSTCTAPPGGSCCAYSCGGPITGSSCGGTGWYQKDMGTGYTYTVTNDRNVWELPFKKRNTQDDLWHWLDWWIDLVDSPDPLTTLPRPDPWPSPTAGNIGAVYGTADWHNDCIQWGNCSFGPFYCSYGCSCP